MIAASKCDLSRPAGSAEEDNAPVDVDAILQSILGRGGERFGMVAAVLRGERIIAQGAAGVRKRGTAERITLDNQFHLGSCTKAMTSTLVAMLVEEGKLNWTTTLRERLFQPLGISTGGFGPPGTADKTEQAWGHSPVLGKPLDPRSPAAELELFYGPAALAHIQTTESGYCLRNHRCDLSLVSDIAA